MAKKYRYRTTIEAFTFDEFVQAGIDAGANLVDGIPWSWMYKNHPVTHENDNLYLVGAGSKPTRFHKGTILCDNPDTGLYTLPTQNFKKFFTPLEEYVQQDDKRTDS